MISKLLLRQAKKDLKVWFYLSCHFLLIGVYHILSADFHIPHPFFIRRGNS